MRKFKSYQAAARHLHALEDKEPILGLCPDGQLLLQVWIDGHTSNLVDKEEASKEDQGGHRRRAQFWAAPSLPSHAAATRLAFVAPSKDHPSHSLHMLMVGLWLYRRLPAHCRNHHMAAC